MLISGRARFFGRWILEGLQYANVHLVANLRATVLSRNPSRFLLRVSHLVRLSIEWVPGSVTTISSAAFAGRRFDGVIHLATESDSQATVDDPPPAIDVITNGARRFLDIAVRTGAKRFIFASSSSVYGKQPPSVTFINETYVGVPNPNDFIDAYAISGEAKRQAELLCMDYAF